MRLLESIPRTAVALLVLPAAIALLSGLVILVALATRSDRKVHRVYLAFARTCLFVGGTKLELSGADHVKPGQAYVVVANHESNWDPPSIIAGLPGLILRFIVKREMMRIPIFGHALRVSGNVRVERNRTQADVERIRRHMQERPSEVSMLFFAEGTRSRDGALHPFKKGAFATASSHGCYRRRFRPTRSHCTTGSSSETRLTRPWPSCAPRPTSVCEIAGFRDLPTSGPDARAPGYNGR